MFLSEFFDSADWVVSAAVLGFVVGVLTNEGAPCSHPRLVSTATRQNSELTAARFYDVIKTSQIRILVKNKGALFREVTRLWVSSLIPDSL